MRLKIKRYPQTAIYGKAGSSLDPATSAWIAAVISAGGTVSGTQQTRVDTFIKALKSAPNGNLFNIMDRVWLYNGESDAHQANIDVINLGVSTPTGTITLSAGGYTGNGTTGYLDTGFIPSTAGGHFTQNSASMFAYMNAITGASGSFLGTQNTGGTVYAYLGEGSFAAELNSGSFPAYTTSTNGLYVSSRTGSAGFTVYQNVNGGSTGSAPATTALTDTSTTLSNNKIFVSAGCNAVGVASGFISDKIQAAGFGGGLTLAQVTDFSAALNTYMTSWGTGVYS